MNDLSGISLEKLEVPYCRDRQKHQNSPKKKLIKVRQVEIYNSII